MKQLFLTFLSFLSIFSTFGQAADSIPKNYFRSPLGIPLYLAGNFGELRSNHFHSGLDMKTQGKEGFNVYAAAEGYVSRVKISPWGYGKTIYIDHPNGYTTVYAHLQKFKGDIAEKIKAYQYKNESWEIDWYPDTNSIMVNKGDILALSGNTGGSGGPHLHFEIRETKTEFPVNPLLFGFDIKDDIKPIIKSVAFFPVDEYSVVNRKNQSEQFQVIGSNGKYKLKYPTAANAYGNVGIGIETIDKLNGVSNRNGIYSIQLEANGEIIYLSEMEKFSFDESRGLNALIDYKTYLKTKKRYQKSFIEPNNSLSIYKQSKNNGIINLTSNDTVDLKYTIFDTYGNKSTLNFQLFGSEKPNPNSKLTAKVDTIFNFSDSNYFAAKNVSVNIPKNALYKDLAFEFGTGKKIYGAITPTYQIHNDYTPIHHPIEVNIKPGRIAEELREKAIIVCINRNGKYYSKGGKWRNNTLSTKSKTFGGFAVMIDTIPPKLSAFNIIPNRNMANYKQIAFTIGDNLSGIKSYNGYIDGKWVIMEYEAKKARIFYNIDNLPKGKHEIKVIVEDGVGNKTEKSIPFSN